MLLSKQENGTRPLNSTLEVRINEAREGDNFFCFRNATGSHQLCLASKSSNGFVEEISIWSC